MFACINKVIRQYGIDSEAERKLLRRENVNAIDKLIICIHTVIYYCPYKCTSNRLKS